MNDRILDLADEANVSQLCRVDGDWGSKLSPELQHFAELIVKECCDVFVELRTRPADLAVLDVKKHFGVQQ